ETATPTAQQPAPAGGEPSPGGVSVDSVDYDDKGNLALSGTAEPGSTVEPKIAGAESGSESLGKVRADEKGEWRLRVERNVAPGRYDLTVEERGPGGEPRSRIRLPFERADPITDFPPGDVVVVQPGNSLWRIARRVYGQGVRYTVIYAANRAQIGDPDLIFPGQIFSVPQEDRTARAPG
ncbi:MAG: LysM peptidoglycan-binding domain-containing protein, partial [Alphaproteobacteria bacterium]|nr:LysM peptidoglycan-binding domain-containing protein [Alphaproteobacteria bacterium]